MLGVALVGLGDGAAVNTPVTGISVGELAGFCVGKLVEAETGLVDGLVVGVVLDLAVERTGDGAEVGSPVTGMVVETPAVGTALSFSWTITVTLLIAVAPPSNKTVTWSVCGPTVKRRQGFGLLLRAKPPSPPM